MAERKARIKGSIESLRSVVTLALDAADKKKLTTPEYTLSISRRTPAPEVSDEMEIPSRFWVKPDPVIDRAALNAAVKAAAEKEEEIPGVTVGEPVASLTIRCK